jgi:hypothetical protein
MSRHFDQTNTAAPTVHVRIGRLAVDAAALGDMPRERLGEQLQAELAQRLSGATSHPPERGLAQHIADAAAPQIQTSLKQTSRTDRHGAI